MKKLYVLLLVLLLGTACGPAFTAEVEMTATDVPEPNIPPDTITAVPEPDMTATAVPEPEMTATAVPEPDTPHNTSDTIIIYGRSGGFAGLQQEWTIHANGQIVLPDGSQKEIDVAQAQVLFDTVKTANFQSLNEAYMPKDICCDLFTYTVTVQTGNETQTITTMDEAPNVPAELTAVLQTINELIQTVE